MGLGNAFESAVPAAPRSGQQVAAFGYTGNENGGVVVNLVPCPECAAAVEDGAACQLSCAASPARSSGLLSPPPVSWRQDRIRRKRHDRAGGGLPGRAQDLRHHHDQYDRARCHPGVRSRMPG